MFLMRGLFATALIVMLGGCFQSSGEVWPPRGGDEVPFVAENVSCISYSVGEARNRDYVVLKEKDDTGTTYILDGEESKPVTFHHVKEDIYIIVQDEDDSDNQDIKIAKVTPEYVSVLDTWSDNSYFEMAAKTHGVELSSGELSGSPAAQKAFVIDVAANALIFGVTEHCTPKL